MTRSVSTGIPRYPSITESVWTIARATPHATAVCQGDQVTTYACLLAGAERVRRALREADLEPGSVVAVGARWRSPGLVAAMIGTLAARCVLLMIDAELADERSATIARLARARHIVWAGRRGLPAWARELPHTIADAVCDAADAAHPPVEWTFDGPANRDPAYVFFTSGSTGTPKGVLGAHDGLAHFIAWQRNTFDARPSDRCAALTRVSFDVMLRDVFLPLSTGACLLLPEERDARPDHVLSWLRESEATWVHLVPSLTRLWLESAGQRESLPRLRATFFAGERLTDSLVRAWRAVAPHSAIMNLYGPTETTLAKCCAIVGQDLVPGVQPVGTPLPYTQVFATSPDGGACPPDVSGELVIRTPFRTLGYLEGTAPRTADSSASCFRVNPATGDPDDLLYHTGDLGVVRCDGSVEVLGRIDDQIKLHGVRIEPAEIEHVLIAHCGLRDAVVVLLEGSGEQPRLAAFVVAGDRAPTPSEIRGAVAPFLPRAMIPSEYVYIDAVPLTANGKRDRRSLQARANAERRATRIETTPADADLVSRIVAAWRAALGRDDVGPADDVFTLGATSVVALTVAAKLSVELARDIPVGAIIARPTPRDQSEWIQEIEQYLARHAECTGVRYGADRPRIAFAFPPLLGYGLAFAGLASHLTGHALQAFDLPESGDPVASLTTAVRAIDAHGPYEFVGYSAGGNLAFDVAVALEREGARVDRIVMLDSEHRHRPEALDAREVDDIVWGNIENLAGLMRETEQFRAFVRNEYLIERMAAKMRAYLRYESTTANTGRTSADIHYVHSDDREPCVTWRASTTGEFMVHRGRGRHVEMTLPENAEHNGRLLDHILRNHSSGGAAS